MASTPLLSPSPRTTPSTPSVRHVFTLRPWVKWALVLALAVQFIKVTASIVWEYRFYFPADMNAAFLIDRDDIFHGLYRAGFYTHIIASPVALVLAAYLIVSSWRGWTWSGHRIIGRIQILLTLGLLVPSGLIMSWHSFGGPLSGVGFALQALATGVAGITAITLAFRRKFAAHRRWTLRYFLLLCSPLFFRIIMGALITADWDSVTAYRINAWVSWLLPLIGIELYWRFSHTLTQHDAAKPITNLVKL